MNKKTHQIGGVCSGAIVASQFFNPPYDSSKFLYIASFITGSFIGSLLPDIDHKNSAISHKLKLTSKLVTSVCSHRGVIHAPITSIVFYGGLYCLNIFLSNPFNIVYKNFVFGLLVGALSHLLLDSLTVEGIPMFYPFSDKKYRLMKIKVGKYEEIVQITIIILTLLMYKYLL